MGKRMVNAWLSLGLLLSVVVPLDAVGNDVFRTDTQNASLTSASMRFSPRTEARKEGNLDALRNFFMTNIEDREICSVPGLKDLIIKDGNGIGWWARRCWAMSSKVPSGNAHTGKDKKFKFSHNTQKKLNSLLKKAQCRPVRRTVEVEDITLPDYSFVPCQVSLKRCQGCCNSDILECVPIESKVRKFTVMKLKEHKVSKRSTRSRYQMPKGSSFLHKVSLLEHRKCACECKEKSTDCSPKQEYNPHICKCVCPTSIQKTCPYNMVWSENTCSCVCLRKKQCTTTMKFNEETCKCEIKNSLKFFDYPSRR